MGMLRCGVVPIGTQEGFARVVFDDLQAQDSSGIELLWRPEPCEQTDCDLLILPTEAENFGAVSAELARLRADCPACSTIVSCNGLVSEQIAALLTAGAFDFVSTPYSVPEFHMRLQRAAGKLSGRCEHESSLIFRARTHGLIGSSPCFMKLVSSLPIIAGCDASALILGETGTGKEVFARAIHYLSPRASRPRVTVNCGAIPTELMESELFGCVRGAFTSAHAARSGLVREAEGGTLFLDEIDSLPFGAQAKLLRFLEEKEYRPVGGTCVHRADVRVIAASNNDLLELTERGAFRSDLYFRLNVLKMVLPALRHRREDILELAKHFAHQFARQGHRPALGFTCEAQRKLVHYGWPGNVRELHNVIERAVLFSQAATIDAGDLELPVNPATELTAESFRAAKARTVEAFERSYIERLLTINAGNITRAAIAAQKNRRAFFALMRKHAIVPERFRGSTELDH
jgi:two-component system, NtrC family, response regulator GlrR